MEDLNRILKQHLQYDFYEMKLNYPDWTKEEIIESLRDTYIEVLEDRLSLLEKKADLPKKMMNYLNKKDNERIYSFNKTMILLNNKFKRDFTKEEIEKTFLYLVEHNAKWNKGHYSLGNYNFYPKE